MTGAHGLRVRGLAKSFGSGPVLSAVDLDVPAGTLSAVLGPSGSGKTTLLRIVAGFEHPDGGVVEVGDRRVAGEGEWVPPERRRIGYVAQEGALFPHLSVSENVGFGLSRANRRDRSRIGNLLDLVGLDRSLADRQPGELSGGEQQRVALARALAPSPDLVLLDEPFASLDAGLRVETRQAVAEAIGAAGATAVLVTHDQGEALSMGDQVAVLLDGRLAQVARPVTLYECPVSPDVARFVGEAVFLAGRLNGSSSVETALGTLALRSDVASSVRVAAAVTVLVRPEQIVWDDDVEAHGVLATIVSCTYFGHDATLEVELADGARLSVRSASPLLVPVRSCVRLQVRGPVVAYAPAVG